MNTRSFSFFIGVSVLLGIGCTKLETNAPSSPSGNTVVAKGDRALGFHITESSSGYVDSFTNAGRTGFDVVNLHFFWGVGNFAGTLPGTPLETNSAANCLASSTYDMTNFSAAHAFYPANSKDVTVTIGTYDGPNKFTPACAANLAFNSSTVKTMFHYLLDVIFATVDPSPKLEFKSLVIGNEIDSHAELQTCATTPSLSTNWANYKEFFEDAMAYAKTKRPGIKVGVSGTMYGLLNTSRGACYKAVTENADFISVTYYPLNADFSVKDPSVVESDFAALVAMFPGKTIYLQEVGYPSGSTYMNSSTAKQSEFFEKVFSAWDKYYDNIKVVSVVNLHEWSNSTVDGFGTLYGICPGAYCNIFKEYLQTLGVRTPSGTGTDKPGFQTIIDQAKARGW